MTTGTGNVAIGKEASPASNSSKNSMQKVISSLRCNTTSISSLSDQRDKTEIVNDPIGLDFINKVRPVNLNGHPKLIKQGKDGSYEAGFIAQEFQSVKLLLLKASYQMITLIN